MDKITDTKTEFRLKQWTQIVQTCQASGMTAVSWCNQNNVNIKSYYYWLRRIRTLAIENGPVELQGKGDRISKSKSTQSIYVFGISIVQAP